MIIQGVTISSLTVVDVPDIISANLSMNLDAATYTSGVTWNDSTDNNRDANIVGTATTYVTSTGHNIIYFNGSVFANVYTGFGTTLNTAAGYTFDVWCQPAASNTSYTLIGEWSNNTVNSGWTDAQMGFLSNNRIAAGYFDGGVAIASTPATAGGTWYHIVFTYNGSNQGNLYVNGIKVASTGIVIKSNPDPATYLSLGKSDGFGLYLGGVNGNFVGNIGAWKVYNRALTDSQITQNYNALRWRYGL